MINLLSFALFNGKALKGSGKARKGGIFPFAEKNQKGSIVGFEKLLNSLAVELKEQKALPIKEKKSFKTCEKKDGSLKRAGFSPLSVSLLSFEGKIRKFEKVSVDLSQNVKEMDKAFSGKEQKGLKLRKDTFDSLATKTKNLSFRLKSYQLVKGKVEEVLKEGKLKEAVKVSSKTVKPFKKLNSRTLESSLVNKEKKVQLDVEKVKFAGELDDKKKPETSLLKENKKVKVEEKSLLAEDGFFSRSSDLKGLTVKSEQKKEGLELKISGSTLVEAEKNNKEIKVSDLKVKKGKQGTGRKKTVKRPIAGANERAVEFEKKGLSFKVLADKLMHSNLKSTDNLSQLVFDDRSSHQNLKEPSLTGSGIGYQSPVAQTIDSSFHAFNSGHGDSGSQQAFQFKGNNALFQSVSQFELNLEQFSMRATYRAGFINLQLDFSNLSMVDAALIEEVKNVIRSMNLGGSLTFKVKGKALYSDRIEKDKGSVEIRV